MEAVALVAPVTRYAPRGVGRKDPAQEGYMNVEMVEAIFDKLDEALTDLSRWDELTYQERREVLLAYRHGLMKLSNLLNALPPSITRNLHWPKNGAVLSCADLLDVCRRNIFIIEEALGLKQPSA